MEAIHSNLMRIARRYAQSQEAQPGVVGMVLYGSLASGDPPELTPLSDVDIALILDRELPAHFTEHRLFDDTKVDVLLFHVNTLRELVAKQPERLYQGGWVLHFLIKSFLQGSAETILFDPTGVVAETKRKLNALTSYEAVVLPDADSWREQAQKDCLAPASDRFQQGKFEEAVGNLRGALWTWEHILRTLAATKTLDIAAGRLGIAPFCPAATELRQMLTPSVASIEGYWQAAYALWDYTYRQLYEPVQDDLLRVGVGEPAKLELVGDYPLFWPGNRIHELGRLIAEVNLSFTWSRMEADQGNLYAALAMLWPCGAIRTKERCRGLAAALKDAGYDISPIVTAFLQDAEFERLAMEADSADKQTRITGVSSTQAQKALHLAGELQQMVDRMLASHTVV